MRLSTCCLFLLASLANAALGADAAALEMSDAWGEPSDEEFAIEALDEGSATTGRALIGSGVGSAGTLSCVVGDNAATPAVGESNSPGCGCDTASAKPCKVFQAAPPAYFCRSEAVAAALVATAGKTWATPDNEPGVSDCSLPSSPSQPRLSV